ncbi:MAG: hypothetical protein JW715_15540 [Sedimentisphaerales bacterium]|nr:hypothetical protein [Sedimentisphaerales bacterium]
MILSNLLKIALCYILAFMFSSFSHYISFVGLRVHYWFVKDYDTIRAWANDVELPDENGLIYMNGVDIPEHARPFHPEDVYVKEEHGVRKLVLSWNSGFMQVAWSLIILGPEEIYQPEEGMLARIEPGVYLHFQFSPH